LAQTRWFKDKCRQANLPALSAHGIRKATATDLAEQGASPHQIQAVTGHRTLSGVTRYTEAAQRRGLADAAMALLKK
jgi:site-specific recombinase XerD